MNDESLNKDFDDFLKKRYEKHTIEPEKALWEAINTRLYHRKTDKNLLRLRQIKVGIYSLAAILVGTIIYFEIKTRNYQTEPKPQITEIVHPVLKSEKNLLSANNTSVKISESIRDTVVIISNRPSSGSDNNIKTKIILTDNNKNADITTISSSPVLNPDLFKGFPPPFTTTGKIDSSIFRTFDITAIELARIPKYVEQGSLKLLEPITSLVPNIVLSDLSKPANLKRAGAGVITKLTEKPDQGDIKLSGIAQNLTQSETSGAKDSERKRIPFFIEGFASPEISYRALTANPKHSVQDYNTTYFNKKENADFTFSAGISGGLGLTKNLILKTGVFYSRYSLKFKTDDLHFIKTGTSGMLIYTSSGPVSLKLISSDTISNESLIKSSINVSYLNIPLIAEFHFLNNYFINIGLNFNLIVGQNMNWQAEGYNGDFSNAIADPIDGLKAENLSLIAGFGTERFIAPKLSLIINPLLKINLTSINNIAPVKSYPYSWGLNVGLRYYFD